MNKKAVLGLLLFGFTGCASTPVAIKVQYLAGDTTYPVQSAVSILQSPPSGAYISIALLTASGAAGITQTQVIGALEQKAQALGANAVIVKDQSETTPSDNVTYNPAGGQYGITAPQTEIVFSGLAIIIQSDTETTP
jgi:hypothetical protein